jgi:hypothetical protein
MDLTLVEWEVELFKSLPDLLIEDFEKSLSLSQHIEQSKNSHILPRSNINVF